MNCRWTQGNLSAYAEGELTPAKRLAVRLHLTACSNCFERADRLADLGSLASQLAPVRPPENLNMRLRLAVYGEMARETWWVRTWRALRAGMKDVFRPLAIRGVGGLAAAMLLFAVVMPDLWTVRAASLQDVPLRYLAKGFVAPPAVQMIAPNGIREDVTVVAYINTQGQVYDLEVIYPGEDVQLRSEIAATLLLSEFEPASIFGQPVAGRLMITFTHYTVKG